MNLKKKAQVIMLPTKHSNLSLYENKLSLAKANHNGIPDKMIPQHLFIVDDYYNILKNDIINTYKETIKIIKFYLNI